MDGGLDGWRVGWMEGWLVGIRWNCERLVDRERDDSMVN